MPFAAVRFLDKEVVLKEVARMARAFLKDHPQVVAVWLFGSFAWGTLTPGSDVNLLLGTPLPLPREAKVALVDAARQAFASLPCPVDLFVASSEELWEGGAWLGRIRQQRRKLT
ncbi:MAG: nucleotidyltransferase domain-containing protein [Thermoanaerobaculum sp.]